ncbi:MAG: tetratricopeptide repeat protein, partial [Spirochaetaceae bacterium]|nr:tetratricopeptide repeat protein [Spirochaetaceae bacterium]
MKKFLYVTADVKYGVSQYGGYVMKIFARIFLLYVLTIVVLSSCSTLDLAVMANNRGDYKSAAKYYTRYIKEREKENMEFNSFIYEERARMYLRTGEPEKARADYEAIIRNDTYPLWAMYVSAVEWIFHTYVPTSAFKVWARGNSTYNHARYADRNENEIIIRKTYELAIKYFSEAIDIAPDYASAYRDRANCYFGMGNYDQAGEDFEKAIARYSDKGINPEDLIGKNLDIVYMYTKLVAIYEKRKDFDKAIEYYNILSKNNPDKDWSVYGESGVIVEKVKELAATGWTKQPAAASAEPVRQSSVPSVSLADDLLNIASGKADAKYWTGRAERGEARAQFELGVHYHNGTGGVRKDMARAVSWYTRAAESGYDPAQYNLALCYLDGAGVIKNEKKAFEWFVNAAEHGHAEAQYNAGVCYYFGEGTTKDLSKAAWWFSKSAEQKNVDA